METVRWKRVGAYVATLYAASLLASFAFSALGGVWGSTSSLAFGVGYMFLPSLAALTVHLAMDDATPAREALGLSRPRWRWLLLAWLGPVVFAFLALAVAAVLPGVRFEPSMEPVRELLLSRLSPAQVEQAKPQLERLLAMSPWTFLGLSLVQALVAGPSINALAAFGEEAGWRGFLQRELLPLGFWRSSWLVGLVWGLWHAPLILRGHNYPQHPVAGVGMMVAVCLLLAPPFAFVRRRVDSVIGAAIAHGSFNATAGLSLLFLSGGSDLTNGMTGLAGLLSLAAANALCAVALQREGSAPPPEPSRGA